MMKMAILRLGLSRLMVSSHIISIFNDTISSTIFAMTHANSAVDFVVVVLVIIFHHHMLLSSTMFANEGALNAPGCDTVDAIVRR